MYLPGREEDPRLWAIVDEYVLAERRYLSLLHGNFLEMGEQERSVFVAALRADADRIDDDELDGLFGFEWRARLTAAWLAGFSGRTTFRERVGQLLLESQLTYSGQGYVVALASWGDERSMGYLVDYLRAWLPRVDRRYDQAWAMAALSRSDEAEGTTYSLPFLARGGPWEAWARTEQLDQRREFLDRVLDEFHGR